MDEEKLASTAPEEPSMKTPQDLAIEQLQVQLNELRNNYETKLKEAQQVNQSLWAELHNQTSNAPAEIQEISEEEAAEKMIDEIMKNVIEKLKLM